MNVRDSRDMGRPWRFGGFWVENLSFAPSQSRPAWLPYTDVVVPLYAVVIVTLVIPGVAVLGMVRRRTGDAIFHPPKTSEPTRAPNSGTNIPRAELAG